MVSFSDDMKGLSARVRFGVQILAVLIGLLLLPVQLLLGTDMLAVIIVSYAIIAVGWLWFINLYNLMDGIDGITCVETISFMLGVTIISVWFGLPLASYSIVVAVAAIGFLFFNWHPASVFMGDVGSVVLGFIIGWLLVQLSLYGFGVSAFILASYYLADTGITLIKRLLKKENIFQAHSEHYYQQAVKNGMTHSKISLTILKLNLVLIVLATITAVLPLSALVTLPISLVSVWLVLRSFKFNS
jgi:UDP-N-acetylmuramyl pentapeptide phosphotransferase/UDP-N-acetylglucosamine-1-phosphate transferase